MSKAQELRKESIKELESKLLNTRKKHMELRFAHASGTLKNPVELRMVRKDIARLLAVINEKKNEKK